MLGAIAGDVIGMSREFAPIKTKDFPLFDSLSGPTDDTVLTLAVGRAILDGLPFAETLRDYALAHPTSYGHGFWNWAMKGDLKPYGSWGNGASMRTSACAWLATDLTHALDLARRQASATHDHPEAVRGAQAVTLAIYLARAGWDARAIRAYVVRLFGYDLSRSVADIRETCVFELKSWVSIPEAIICALEAVDFEDAIRNAISIGGDADTQAAIAGAIAEARFGGVPEWIGKEARARLSGWDDLDADIDALYAAIRPLSAKGKVMPEIEPWDPDAVERWRLETFGPPQADPSPRPNFDWDRFMEGTKGHPPRGLFGKLLRALGL